MASVSNANELYIVMGRFNAVYLGNYEMETRDKREQRMRSSRFGTCFELQYFAVDLSNTDYIGNHEMAIRDTCE